MTPQNDPREWLSAMAKRRITAVEIAEILGVSRTTANARISKGISADDLITISRGLGINPTEALTELGYLDYGEVMTFMDMGGKLLDTAEDGELALELARRLNPAKLSPEIDELAARRAAKNTPTVPADSYDDGTVRPWTDQPHAADNSPDEDQLRWEEENPGADT